MLYPEITWYRQPEQQQKSQQPVTTLDLQDVEPQQTTTTNGSAPDAPEGFTREDIKKARQQEKDKLYPEIQKLKDEVQELRTIREQAEAEQKKREDEAAAALKKREEDEMDVRSLLQTKEAEWEAKIEAERLERERAFALLDRERAYTELQQYRNQAMQAAQDDILPELLDLVSGETPEQIDASVAGLKDRTNRILNATQQATQQTRRETVGSRVTAPPAADPLDNYSGNKTFTPEEIRSMSVEEYAQYRSALLGRGGSGTGVGLFG